ncbi:hypothetical protein GCM10022245_45300 [Streptomyces mayteni]
MGEAATSVTRARARVTDRHPSRPACTRQSEAGQFDSRHDDVDDNQSRGTRAYMYDRYGTTIYTTPGAYSSDGDANWSPVWSMIPC